MLWRKKSASDGGAKGLRADITTGAKVLPVYRYIDTLLFLPDYCHTYSDYMRHIYVFCYVILNYINLCIVGEILVYLVLGGNWMLVGDILNGRWAVAFDLLLPLDEVNMRVGCRR